MLARIWQVELIYNAGGDAKLYNHFYMINHTSKVCSEIYILTRYPTNSTLFL